MPVRPEPRLMTRRAALHLGAAFVGSASLPDAGAFDVVTQEPARLKVRPGKPRQTAGSGHHRVQEGNAQALAHVPASVTHDVAAPLVLFLHGALRRPELYLEQHVDIAEETGIIVRAPYSTIGTWDAIRGTFGRDIAILDSALRWVFDRWLIDPRRIVISGFSDGGTYALSVGIANGDLFARIVAWSPGFVIPVTAVGKPPVLITHGTEDQILPIDRTSRQIVPALRRAGYAVDYREFKGPHAVPKTQLEDMMRALAASR